MKIILEIQGFQKEVEVSPYILRQGWIKISVEPPLNYVFEPKNIEIKPRNIYSVMLFYKGRQNDFNLPIFEMGQKE